MSISDFFTSIFDTTIEFGAGDAPEGLEGDAPEGLVGVGPLKRRASCFSLDAKRAARLVLTLEFRSHPEPFAADCKRLVETHFPPAAYLFFWHLDILIRMRLVLLVILLIILTVLVYFATQELVSSQTPFTQYIQEPFQSPTRASDCRCLPGYIPTKGSSEYISLGCFNDSGERALKGAIGRPHTRDSCAVAAKAAGAKYFGIQDGNECWVGNEGYDRYGKAGGDCKLGGGPWKNHVWKIASPGDLETYFCQNLDDSQKTKACY